MFGSTTNNTNSTFGSGNNNAFGNNANLNSSLQNIPESAMPWWLRELLYIQSAYSGGSGSRMCTYMFDKMPSELRIIAMSSPVTFNKLKEERKKAYFSQYPWLDERQWNSFDKKCPEGYLPTPIIGIQGLQERVQSQVSELNDQLSMLKIGKENEATSSWLESLKYQGSIDLKKKVEKCNNEQDKLDNRFLKVAGRIEEYLALVSNQPMTQNEMNFHEEIITKREKLNKLTKRISVLRTQLESNSETLQETATEESKMFQLAELKKGEETEMLEFVHSQQEAISKLLDIVRKDIRDINLIKKGKA